MATFSNLNLRETKFLKAQFADEAGRHDHSVRFMIEISKSVTPSAELSPLERKFLVNSLKKFLDDHRQAWYKINSETFKWVGVQSQVARSYLKRISGEILNVCKEIELLINGQLILSAQSAESRVFYLTFKGDVKAYMAEMKGKEGESEEAAAILAYQEAKAIARADLTWLSPARLTLALSITEFYTEILELPDLGTRIARKALKNAKKAGANLTEGEIAKEINELLSKLRKYVPTVTNNEDGEAKEGTSTSPTQLVAGTSLAQEASPSETGEKAGTSGTDQPAPPPKRAAEEAETSVTRASLQPEPGKESRTSETPLTPPIESSEKIRTSETLSMPLNSPGESPPLTSPPPPPPLTPTTKGKRKIDEVYFALLGGCDSHSL